jgi:hypothetical protein
MQPLAPGSLVASCSAWDAAISSTGPTRDLVLSSPQGELPLTAMARHVTWELLRHSFLFLGKFFGDANWPRSPLVLSPYLATG